MTLALIAFGFILIGYSLFNLARRKMPVGGGWTIFKYGKAVRPLTKDSGLFWLWNLIFFILGLIFILIGFIL